MITFCDALKYCDVHGHDSIIVRDNVTLDMAGNKMREEKCVKCGMLKETMIVNSSLRMSSTFYPKGIWE